MLGLEQRGFYGKQAFYADYGDLQPVAAGNSRGHASSIARLNLKFI